MVTYTEAKEAGYDVTTCGAVIGKTGKELQLSTDRSGYKYVIMYINKKFRRAQVHQLVAQKYIPNPDSKPCINHKDCIRDNNNVDNLEWCTYSENNHYAYEHGLRVDGVQVECVETKGIYKTNAAAAQAVDADEAGIRRARRTGCKCKGYHWRTVKKGEQHE